MKRLGYFLAFWFIQVVIFSIMTADITEKSWFVLLVGRQVFVVLWWTLFISIIPFSWVEACEVTPRKKNLAKQPWPATEKGQ
jgi:hypothetical protein